MNAVLSDIVVVDLSHVLAGPYCTMMLGGLGATVIKVEWPGQGDNTREVEEFRQVIQRTPSALV